MHRELHFPTPIYIADIDHPTLNQELERDIVTWSKQDKGILELMFKVGIQRPICMRDLNLKN